MEKTGIYKRLLANTLNIPNPAPLNNTGDALPYVFIGDEAFPPNDKFTKTLFTKTNNL